VQQRLCCNFWFCWQLLMLSCHKLHALLTAYSAGASLPYTSLAGQHMCCTNCAKSTVALHTSGQDQFLLKLALVAPAITL
jgi:hypothetical protein